MDTKFIRLERCILTPALLEGAMIAKSKPPIFAVFAIFCFKNCLSCYPVLMNLFENIPDDAPEELVTELLNAECVRIERIVSFGQASPGGFWYDQTENEWVLLLEGSATVAFEKGGSIELNPGDYATIPAGKRHRVEETDPNVRTVWLAVFYTGRTHDAHES